MHQNYDCLSSPAFAKPMSPMEFTKTFFEGVDNMVDQNFPGTDFIVHKNWCFLWVVRQYTDMPLYRKGQYC